MHAFMFQNPAKNGGRHRLSMLLGGRFGYFSFCSARGGGRGSPRRREWGGLLDILGRGGVLQDGRGRRAGGGMG